MSQPLFELYKDALRRGHLAVIDGRLDDALVSYREAGEMAPDRALPYASLATVLHRLGRSDEAIAAFDRALELAPDDMATLRARWVALEEMGRLVDTPFGSTRAAAGVDADAAPDADTRAMLEAALDARLGLIPGEDHPAAARDDIPPAGDPADRRRADVADRSNDEGTAQQIGFGPGFETPGPYLPFEEGVEGDPGPQVTWPAIDLPSPPPPPLVFTLIAPLGLPWWVPVMCLAVVGAASAGLRQLALRKGRELWSGLAVLRRLGHGSRVVGFVLVAVFAQIFRNWLLLHAVGVDASFFDAIAVLIALAALAQLPVGPSVGAAASVLILGRDGVAAAAAAGVLMTVTGTIGGLCFAAWAGADRLWSLISRARLRRAQARAPRSH